MCPLVWPLLEVLVILTDLDIIILHIFFLLWNLGERVLLALVLEVVFEILVLLP